uniref:Uncharacterized protein n=1 Tax=uncultured Microgenomates bacterium Rifle_16ft_4_minimus_5036 TaxID=1665119 RepID=A0A0H4TU10_9BACT|nr:hypothetical protein [uncultured Microgenomates bacterium Rifle_16ft_4_minimus_5036]
MNQDRRKEVAAELSMKALEHELRGLNSSNPYKAIDEASLAKKLKVVAGAVEPKPTLDSKKTSPEGFTVKSLNTRAMGLEDVKNIVSDYKSGRRIRGVDIDDL